MNFFDFLWNEALVRPTYNALMFFYVTGPVPNLGSALILFTLALRFILLPLTVLSALSNHQYEKIQNEVAKIKGVYAANLEEQKKRLRSLFRKHSISPYYGLASIVVQVIMFALLYDVFIHPLQPLETNWLYDFFTVKKTDATIDTTFFNLFELSQPSIIVSLIAGVLVFVQQIFSPAAEDEDNANRQRWILYLLPVVTFLGTAFLPASKAVYVMVSVLFSVVFGLFFQATMTFADNRKKKKEKLKKASH